MTRRSFPPYCYQKPRGVYFQRRGWETRRFQAEPFTPEFAAEYALILRGTPPVAPGGKAFTALVRSYKKSPRWTDLAPRSKQDYQKVLDYILDKFGSLPADKMQMKDVIRAQLSNAETVRFANYIVQVFRVLFIHAKELGWRQDNPTDDIRLLKSDRAPRKAWPADLVEAYRAAAPIGTRQRLIFELLLGTAQRIGDVLQMRWDDLSQGGIHVRQSKTGTRLWIPLTRDLRLALDATKRTGMTILAQPNSHPSSYRGAADLIMSVRRKIGAEAYDNHALRYTAAAELDALGLELEVIMAVTGHKSRDMALKYIGEARQRRLATVAMKRREE